MFSVDHIAVSILMALSGLLGIQERPADTPDWVTLENFNVQENHPQYVASSQSIPAACRVNPEAFLTFPVMIHGAHQLFLDGILIDSFGDNTFQSVRSFYGAPTVSCKKIMSGQELRWQVTSYCRYFSRFSFFPKISSVQIGSQFIQETMNAVAAGNLFFLALMCIVIFRKRISKDLTWSFVVSNIFFAVYFVCCAPSIVGLTVPMLTAHKIADSSLWIGVFFLFNVMRKRNLILAKQLSIYAASALMALIVISSGTSGDIIQFGTLLPFIPFFGIMLYTLFNLVVESSRLRWRNGSTWQILSLGSFASMALSDALTVTGLTDSPMVLSIGIVGSSAFIGLDLNRKIVEMYREIDYLRANLEVEVERKTVELKAAQADMIASAKMASLGTLSAGIAHEINNSLNYVHGAVLPMKRIVKSAPEFEGQKKALSLLQVMEEGLAVTFAIMTSLRTYSGLNHAKIKEYRLIDLVKSILNILRSKMQQGIVIELLIPEDLHVEVNGAGLNQVLMNLIINGIDAIHAHQGNTGNVPQGKITISGGSDGQGGVLISVADNGPGIPPEIVSKIFDPFFTTKDVGQGTGLGLHISRAEVIRHKGTLSVKSEKGQGATFTIHLPKVQETDAKGAIAA